MRISYLSSDVCSSDLAPNVGLCPYRKKPCNPTIFPLRGSGRTSPTIWKNWRQTNLGFTLKMRSAIIRVESSRASRGFFQANISKTMKCRERFMSEVRSLALVTCAVSAALAVPAGGQDGPAAGAGVEIIFTAHKPPQNNG